VVPKLFCTADPFNTGISFTHRLSRCGKRTSIDCRYKLGTFESIQNWRWCKKAFVCWNNVIWTFKFQLNCVMSFVVLYSCNWLCIIYFVWTVRQEMPHGQVLGRSPVFGDHCFDSMQFAKAKKFPLPIGNCCWQQCTKARAHLLLFLRLRFLKCFLGVFELDHLLHALLQHFVLTVGEARVKLQSGAERSLPVLGEHVAFFRGVLQGCGQQLEDPGTREKDGYCCLENTETGDSVNERRVK